MVIVGMLFMHILLNTRKNNLNLSMIRFNFEFCTPENIQFICISMYD